MKYYFFYILCCAFLYHNAQNKELDSLNNLVLNYKKTDTNLVNLRLQYANQKIFKAPDSSLMNFNKETLRISKQLNFEIGIISSLQKIAITYQHVYFENLKALEYYKKGIRIIETKEELNIYKIPFLINIGSIYYHLQDFDEALNYFEKALEIQPDNANVLLPIANIYGSRKQYEKALNYLNVAEKATRRKNDEIYLSNILVNKAFMYLETSQYEKAKLFIEEAIELIDKNNIEIMRLNTYINASTIYLMNQDFENAEKYVNLAFNHSESKNNLNTQYALWEAKTNIYVNKQDYKNALEAYDKAVKIKDSITSTDRKLELSKKDFQFEADKAKTIAKEEVKRQKLKNNIYLFSGLGLAIIAITGFIIYRRKQRIIARAKEAEFKVNISETELKVLRSQLNPHFIYNALNSIGDYILKNNSKKASEYLAIFADLMRDILISSEKEVTSINEDIEVLKTYMDIEKIRNQDKFDYQFNIANDIDSELISIPPLLVQPIIENSIKHGFSEILYKGQITINIKLENNLLIYEIDDNGSGRNLNKLNNNKESYGIKITKNRIDIINQQKNTNGYLRIIDKEQGTKVIVAIQLEKNI